MKRIQFLVIVGVLSFLFASCDESTSSPPVYGGPGGGRDGGRFYAQDMTNNGFYSFFASVIWESDKCVVWAENGSGMGISDGEAVADAYDDIYAALTPVFGSEKPFTDVFTNDPTTIAENTMEFADYYGNGDNKLCILLLKIKDGFNPSKGNNSYVAGYFTAYNFLEYEPGYYDSYYSNECDMIYIDVKVNMPGSLELSTTLAHEMQHMMNFVTSLDKRYVNNTFRQMDLWIDEGLSSAAEFVYSGVHNMERVDWFNSDPTQMIANGNNFYVWGNYTTGKNAIPEAILDDYATVYLFFQWLRLQAGDTAIYNEIITSTDSDYKAVLQAAKDNISSTTIYDYSSGGWRYLLRNWMAANWVNSTEDDSPYGYMNDDELKYVKHRYYLTGTSSSFPLAPGEGIYTHKTSMPGATTNIKYAGLPEWRSDSLPKDTSTFGSGEGPALLSYNIDTNVEGDYSYCNPYSMGFAPILNERESVAAFDGSEVGFRGITQPLMFREPYAVGAGDMLKINGERNNSSGAVVSKLRSGKNQ